MTDDDTQSSRRCPHEWCDARWHVLPLTERSILMTLRGEDRIGYQASADTSLVLCPGSEFAGDFNPPDTNEVMSRLTAALTTSRSDPHARMRAAYQRMLGQLPPEARAKYPEDPFEAPDLWDAWERQTGPRIPQSPQAHSDPDPSA